MSLAKLVGAVAVVVEVEVVVVVVEDEDEDEDEGVEEEDDDEELAEVETLEGGLEGVEGEDIKRACTTPIAKRARKRERNLMANCFLSSTGTFVHADTTPKKCKYN